jgi:conjugal transfer pilus assembly protein TraW
MKTKHLVAGLSIVASLALNAGSVTKIENTGDVFPIKEENIVDLIKEHVENNKDKIQAKFDKLREEQKEKIQAYKPPDLSIELSPAREDAIRYPDPSYTLKENIMDAEGKVLYPKGYKFNPLHYINMTDRYVFFDYTRPEQVQWIKEKKYDEQLNVRLIVTNGRIFDAMKDFGREIFYANDLILKRFDVQATPTLAYQEGDRIKLEEYYIPKTKEDNK